MSLAVVHLLMGFLHPARAQCGVWQARVQRAELAGGHLVETSGMAASPVEPGVAWAHNDAGGGAFLVAFDGDGEVRALVAVPGATNGDWEDMASAPCPDAACSCLVVADSGEDRAGAEALGLWFIPEPALSGEVEAFEAPLAPTFVPFLFVGGSWDVEAFAVHRPSGELSLFSKEEGHSSVFLLEEGEARWIADVDLSGLESPSLTAADISPDGDWLLLATDRELLVFHEPGADTVAELLAQTPELISGVPTGAVEAVGWAPDADGGIWMLTDGEDPALWEVRCEGTPDLSAEAMELCPALPGDDGGDRACGCASGAPTGGWVWGVALGLGLCLRREKIGV
jgi:hypothetical protein